jgi:hypothetical protein
MAGMVDRDFVGAWCLTAMAQHSAEAGLIGEDSDPADIDAWLNDADGSGADGETAVAGLTLTIATDARFTERSDGHPAVPWFDAEGVLAEEVAPFDGVMIGSGDVRYLRPDRIASWALPVEGRHGAAALRYDDGDTKIADSVRLVDSRLVRTVNVVTDELYLNRVVLIYARRSG